MGCRSTGDSMIRPDPRRTPASLLACLLLVFTLPAAAQRAPARIPTDPAEVLERLPPGFTAASARRPGKRASTEQISALLALAASSGDARLAARAERLLEAYPADTPDREVNRLRAFAAQHRHDFTGAIALLDRLVASNPRDGRALLSRSQINLVRGDLQAAGRDCAALTLGVDTASGTLCTAALAFRRGQYDAAARMADRALDGLPTGDLRRHALVLRAEVASHEGDRNADRWFRDALDIAPGDVRTVAAHARHLRRAGRPADVLRLLARAPATDGLLLERALAAHALRHSDAALLGSMLERRFARMRAAGDEPELRDEAELALVVRDDAPRALRLASENFRTQRDFEDVDILVRSARAANRPEALEPLHAWERRVGLKRKGEPR